MSVNVYLDSFAALLPEGIISPQGVSAWNRGQNGPQDVMREQVLGRPYLSFGKLQLCDRLAFGAASLILSHYPVTDPETTSITLGITAGSLSTDLRYMESVLSGFPSPAIFSATLPSSAIADIAIFYGLKGPNRVIAGSAASGLSAFELAVLLLEGGKASTALCLSVNAVEPQDFSSPLLDPAIGRENRVYAFLLTTTPRNEGLGGGIGGGFRLSASFAAADKEMPQGGGELYFRELAGLLCARKNGSVQCAACDMEGAIAIEKEG